METWIDSSDFALWKIEFIWQLRIFKNRILRHFDFEEDSGVFLTLPVAENIKGSLGKKIHREHAVLFHELERIIKNLKKLKNAEDANLKSVQSDILILIGEINTHESEEMRLINLVNHLPIKQSDQYHREDRLDGRNRKI